MRALGQLLLLSNLVVIACGIHALTQEADLVIAGWLVVLGALVSRHRFEDVLPVAQITHTPSHRHRAP